MVENSQAASSGGSRLWRWMRVALFAPLGLIVVGLIILWAMHQPRPATESSADAERRVSRMEDAVNLTAWRRTGVVRWTFSGRRRHLWDRRRHLAQVRWGDVEVLVSLNTEKGRAWRGGREVLGAEAEALVAKGYAAWVNDSFWLNPVAKMRDTGTRFTVIPDDGAERVMVTFGSGGLTPGDAYLWTLGDDDLPIHCEMWVSILPVGGVDFGWGQWQTLSTGAKVALRHDNVVRPVLLTEVAGAVELKELVGRDPFCRLPVAGCVAEVD